MRKGEILQALTRKKVDASSITYIRNKNQEAQVVLDNSVFKNFKRLLKSNIVKCVQNDTRRWLGQ